MKTKIIILALVVLLALSLAGCGGNDQAGPVQSDQVNNSQVDPEGSKVGDTVNIAYVAMTTTSPQPLINQKYGIYAEELEKIGKKVNFEPTRSLDSLYPLLDKEEGSPDLVYLPHSAYTTYMTETSKFGGSDKYVIVAGSLDLCDIDLVVRPGVSLKDLAGKKVGISNLRYTDEFQLNQLLSTVGLSTKTMGGQVEVVWDDIVTKTADNYEKGLYDAIVVFNTDNKERALQKVPGSKVYSLSPEGLDNGKPPRIWLAAKKELLASDPDVIKAALKAHVLSTERAMADIDELAAINREVFVGWFKDKGVQDFEAKNPLEKFQKRWKIARVTYDPNVAFINDLFDYLEKKGVVEGKKVSDFMQVDLLDEVLIEMGRPEVK